MNRIGDLIRSGRTKVMIYKHESDDGVMVEYSHGSNQWFRVDNRMYVNVDNYSYWEPV